MARFYVKYDTPFTFAFDNKIQYDAFKALFVAIEQFAPLMISNLQRTAQIGKDEDWNGFTRWYKYMSLEKNVWNALINAVEDNVNPFFSEILNGMLVWSKECHVEHYGWNFLRQAALLTIMDYRDIGDYITFVIRILDDHLSDDEVKKLCIKTNHDPDIALTRIIPPQPVLGFSQHCHINSRVDTWEKLIPYMDGKLSDDAYQFEVLHPFVFAPPSPKNELPDLPETLREKGFDLPIETHPFENLLYRERTLNFANTPSQDRRAKELSKWFYEEWRTAQKNLFFTKNYAGMAYDPRAEDWDTFEKKLDEAYKTYKIAYKQATTNWLAQRDNYQSVNTLRPDKIPLYAELTVHYYMLGKKPKQLAPLINKIAPSNEAESELGDVKKTCYDQLDTYFKEYLAISPKRPSIK